MNGKADKRARKKAVRDQRLAAAAARRQRRMLLLGGVLVVVAVLVGLALFTGGDGSQTAASDQCWSDQARAGDKSYDRPPRTVLDEDTDYSAVVTTSKGDIAMDLLEDEAPATVNNFVCLARDDFYEGIVWHRVEKDLVIQAGDPQGTGQGGPGYQIQDELPQDPNAYTFGAVGMANAGPNTGGSQFFIVVHDPDPKGGFEPAGFPPSYSVFGQVSTDDEDSVATLTRIANAKVAGGNSPQASQPVDPIVIESVEIEEG